MILKLYRKYIENYIINFNIIRAYLIFKYFLLSFFKINTFFNIFLLFFKFHELFVYKLNKNQFLKLKERKKNFEHIF